MGKSLCIGKHTRKCRKVRGCRVVRKKNGRTHCRKNRTSRTKRRHRGGAPSCNKLKRQGKYNFVSARFCTNDPAQFTGGKRRTKKHSRKSRKSHKSRKSRRGSKSRKSRRCKTGGVFYDLQAMKRKKKMERLAREQEYTRQQSLASKAANV